MQAEQGVIVLGDFARKEIPDKKIRLPEASFLVGNLENVLHGLVHGGGLFRISGILSEFLQSVQGDLGAFPGTVKFLQDPVSEVDEADLLISGIQNRPESLLK